MITRKAYAKINLSLDVTGRRPNGYHDVDMVMQAIGLHDVLTFEKSEGEIQIQCTNQPALSCGEDNLIYKAVKKLQEKCGFSGGVKIQLEKNIPMAAGMAGGSTDCAATLLAVNELYELGLSIQELCEVGVTLGADVPYCILGGTARARGIGEILECKPCNVNPILVLVKPVEGVSTKVIYSALDAMETIDHPDVEGMLQALEAGDLHEVAKLLGNVLQPVTELTQPVTKDLCAELVSLGATGAMMSGSGPTVFGLFESKELAEKALQAMKNNRPEYFSCITEFQN